MAPPLYRKNKSLVFASQILILITYKLCGIGQAILAELLQGLSETWELAEVLSWNEQRLEATEPGCGLPSDHNWNFEPQPSLSHPTPAEVQTGLDQIS